LAKLTSIQELVAQKNFALLRSRQLIEIIYWLVILEGAFRKWILVFLAKPLFFVRDPFLLYLYYLTYKYNLQPRKDAFLRAALVLSGVFLALIIAQSFSERISIATGIYGWRMYFLYIPLAFIAGQVLQASDLKRITKTTLLSSIPMAAIALLQYRSPHDAFINRVVEGDAFRYSADLARISGTFSFTQGHMYYCHTLLCFLLATWLLVPKNRPLDGRLLYVATIATCINVVLDGNRAVLVAAITTLAFSLVYRLFLSGSKITWRTFSPELIFVLGGLAYAFLFSDAYEALSSRTVENADEGNGRLAISFTGMFGAVTKTALLGNGIGASSSGGAQLSMGIQRRSTVVINEDIETSRIVVECGPLGILYIAFRYALGIKLMIDGFIASRRTRNPLPFILSNYPAMMLFVGSITFNGNTNGYAWIFVGFSLAANKLGTDRSNA